MMSTLPKIELQVLWLESSLGLAINQRIDNKLLPVTPYYFWPINKAWEQIKFELDSKIWIPEDERINFLNLVADTINCWQENRFTIAATVNNDKTSPLLKILKKNGHLAGLP